VSMGGRKVSILGPKGGGSGRYPRWTQGLGPKGGGQADTLGGHWAWDRRGGRALMQASSCTASWLALKRAREGMLAPTARGSL